MQGRDGRSSSRSLREESPVLGGQQLMAALLSEHMPELDRTGVSDVVRRTAEQVRAQVGDAGLLIAIDDATLRVHIDGEPVVRNVDIAYDRRRDLYDVSVHVFRPCAVDAGVTTSEVFGIYVEQLGAFVTGR